MSDADKNKASCEPVPAGFVEARRVTWRESRDGVSLGTQYADAKSQARSVVDNWRRTHAGLSEVWFDNCTGIAHKRLTRQEFQEEYLTSPFTNILPEDALYLGRDADGQVYAFRERPLLVGYAEDGSLRWAGRKRTDGVRYNGPHCLPDMLGCVVLMPLNRERKIEGK